MLASRQHFDSTGHSDNNPRSRFAFSPYHRFPPSPSHCRIEKHSESKRKEAYPMNENTSLSALGVRSHHVECFNIRQSAHFILTRHSPEPALNQPHCPSLIDEVVAIVSLEPSWCLISTLIS